MTGPYQPPGGDINSPFGTPDPNSPFTPGAGSPNQDSQGKESKDEEESSSLGVQYELEAPGQQPPMTPPPRSGPPAYGPPAAPPPAYAPRPTYAPPPKKSTNNGLIIGGVIAGVVVLLVLAGIIIVVAAVSSSDKEGGDADNAKYKAPSSACSDIDLSPISGIAAFSVEPTPSSSGYGSSQTAMCSNGTIGDLATSSYGYFNMTINSYETVDGAESGYENNSGTTGMSGCSTSEATGSWSKGTIGTGNSSSCALGYANGTMTVLVIQDANLEAKLTLDVTSDLASGAEDALKSVAESLLTASKA